MRAAAEAEFREFAAARMGPLRRTAYLLCRDWHTADDLVSITLDKLYRQWHRRAEITDLDAYTYTVLARSWADECRRPWRRREWLTDDGASPALHLEDAGADPAGVVDRMTIDAYLGALPAGRRAVLILRVCCELSVEETAAALGLSPGTVKSQTSRGLAALKAVAAPDFTSTR